MMLHGWHFSSQYDGHCVCPSFCVHFRAFLDFFVKLRKKYYRINIRNSWILVINNAKSNKKTMGLHLKAQAASALVLEMCSELK